MKVKSRMKADRKLVKTLPKVLLHEHLDGVLRPGTIIDLAEDEKYSDLPTTILKPWLNGFMKALIKAVSPNISKVSHTP